jgi:hypothetical protein
VDAEKVFQRDYYEKVTSLSMKQRRHGNKLLASWRRRNWLRRLDPSY